MVNATIFEASRICFGEWTQPKLGRGIRKPPIDFYLAHFDLTGKTGEITLVGPPAPISSIIRPSHKSRGGQHREDPRLRPWREQRFVLHVNALRVARKPLDGQPEVGWECIRGEVRNAFRHLVGQARVGDRFSARTILTEIRGAIRNVNRALPDAELAGFVDALARRDCLLR